MSPFEIAVIGCWLLTLMVVWSIAKGVRSWVISAIKAYCAVNNIPTRP